MTSSSIQKIQFEARGAIIDSLWKEFQKEGFETERGPIKFTAWNKEFVDVVVPITASLLSLLAAVIVAQIGKNKRVRITFNENGDVKEVEAPTKEELIQILQEARKVEIE